VEIFEQSAAPERLLTKASLAFLENEMTALLARIQEWDLNALVPSGAITRGEPAIQLANSYQPVLYEVTFRVNPGEAGRVYLRAFEATAGVALTANRLKAASDECVGWSSDPTEQFLSNTPITIFEGEWGQPYGALFEVWKAPSSGGAERKLAERTFKIEGWQR